MESIEIINKPRSSSFTEAPASSGRPILHNLRQMRQERLLNRVSTPKTERKPEEDLLNPLCQIQEELKHSVQEAKRPPDLKLVFSKEIRPKSALRGHEENKELIKIAENTANLFNNRRGTSGGTPCASRKKLSICIEENKLGSMTQRTNSNRAVNNVPKPVMKSTELLRKYLKK